MSTFESASGPITAIDFTSGFSGSVCASLRSSTAVHNGAHPAVIGRAEGGRLLLDLRAVPPTDDEALASAVIAAAAITAVRPTVEPGAAAAESQRVAD